MKTFKSHKFPMAMVAAAALLAACGGGGEEVVERAGALSHKPTLAPAPAGLTGTVICDNWRIGAVTVDNVEVRAGMACELDGTTVTGGVKALAGATLIAGNGVQIAGSVQADEAHHVELTGAASRVAGSFEIKKGGSATLASAEVAGSVVFEEQTGAVSVGGARAGGGMKLFKNTGGATVANNTVIGALQCKDNTPAPMVSGNSADSLEDQCFQASSPPPPTPPSGNVVCVGLTLVGLNLDSVIVPDNASCTMIGTTMNGSVEVGANSSLVAQDVNITGNLLSDSAARLDIGGASRVGGSIQVQRGAAASIVGVTTTGSMQITAMTGPVTASGNRLGGNIQILANRGGVTLNNNVTPGGVMQCKDNLPAPTGSGNVASQKQDQCVGL